MDWIKLACALIVGVSVGIMIIGFFGEKIDTDRFNKHAPSSFGYTIMSMIYFSAISDYFNIGHTTEFLLAIGSIGFTIPVVRAFLEEKAEIERWQHEKEQSET